MSLFNYLPIYLSIHKRYIVHDKNENISRHLYSFQSCFLFSSTTTPHNKIQPTNPFHSNLSPVNLSQEILPSFSLFFSLSIVFLRLQRRVKWGVLSCHCLSHLVSLSHHFILKCHHPYIHLLSSWVVRWYFL